MNQVRRSIPRAPRIAAAALLALALAACGGGGGADCSVAATRQFVFDVTQDWYLFLPTPAGIDPGNFATAADLLDALTADARAAGKDRNFSFLTTAQAEQSFFAQGQAIAFGIGTQLRSGHLFVTKAEPDSPAAAAGFARGDEILAIGPTPDQMVAVSTLDQAGIAAAFGPAQVGVMRSLRVQPQAGDAAVRTMTKRLITLDPVPAAQIFQRAGMTPVGYLAFESFIDPAQPQLRDAFASFRAQGVRDLIVDLRYNGGGLISVAQLLANLLATTLDDQVMFQVQFNDRHADAENRTVRFAAAPQSVPAMRIAFIATGATASASELVINSLEPYAQVAIIGARTFGKPVGQSGFRQPGCDTVLRLIAFKEINRDGDGDFYGGLPDAQFSGAFCTADDDLTAARGNPAEASTAAAFAWIDNNACPAAKALHAPPLYPAPAHPDIVQDNRPGLF